MNKNIGKIFLLIFIALTVGGAACKKSDRGNNSDLTLESSGETGNKMQGIIYNEVDFEVIDEENLSKTIKNAIAEMKDQKGYTYFRDENEYTVIVFAGEKNTGGYGIEVVSVEDIEGITKIVVNETGPEKDAFVTQVLTYPKVAIKVSNVAHNFEVTGMDGTEYPKLDDKKEKNEKSKIDAEGIYVGRIDGNSVEIVIEGNPISFRHNENLVKTVKSMQTNKSVKITYYTNEHGQKILTDIAPQSRMKGYKESD